MAISNLVKKIDVSGAVRFMEDKGHLGQSFRDSLELGGVMAEDLLAVTAALQGALNGGLTREAVVWMIQGRMKKQSNGRPFPAETVNLVLDAILDLEKYTQKKAGK